MEKVKNKKVIFMMGAPAAGKSTVSASIREFDGYKILDCDEIKKEHPDYDPKNPSLVHEWSSSELERKFQDQLNKDESFVVDGTGANSDKLIRRITEARQKGFVTELVYVVCSLKASLERNRQRERVVADDVVIEKYKDISFSFETVAPHVDKIKVINNE